VVAPHGRPHRPALPGAGLFEALLGDEDPAALSEAGDRVATLLVRGPRDESESAVVERLVHLAESEGLEDLAALWSRAPSDTLSGCLWRLYLLRSWVHADPVGAARQFDVGRRLSPVVEVVAGVSSPPGAEEVRAMADEVLRGIRVGDFADTLFRAAAFTQLAAVGRAHLEEEPDQAHAASLSAARLMHMADQLHAAARLELAGELS
jgi:hypothetical protein